MAPKRKHMRFGRPSGSIRPRRKRYLVVTNGEVTEPQYFKGLEKELGDVVIEVRPYRRAPDALAVAARGLKGRESNAVSVSGGSVDGFQDVFVVTDVDEFTVDQFQRAGRMCREEGMSLIVTNPCFEVWLIDHLMSCPGSYSKAERVKRKAAELGVVTGNRNKNVVYASIRGMRGRACENAAIHNTQERRRLRKYMNRLDFGPWTDMPDVIRRLEGENRG